jgi:hypothetical protein
MLLPQLTKNSDKTMILKYLNLDIKCINFWQDIYKK